MTKPLEKSLLMSRPTGAIEDPFDRRDLFMASVLPFAETATLPRKFSRRGEKFVPPNQKYGSCVGFASKNLLEWIIWKLTGVRKVLSGRFIYALCKTLDGYLWQEGTTPRAALKVIFGLGAPEDYRWPQEPSPTHEDYIKEVPEDIRQEAIQNVAEGGFARILTANELKQSIMLNGPALVSLYVRWTYDVPEVDGFIAKPLPADAGYNRGPHENIVIGWDDDKHGVGAWEVENNWDKNWADNGYGFVAYDYDGVWPFIDVWGVTNMIDANATSGAPSIGYPVETQTPFVTQKFGVNPQDYAQYGLKGHDGIDFRTKDLKTRYIIACDDGEVILARADGGYGLCIRIKHSWGMSLYGHNSKFLVSEDGPDGLPTKVKRGQRIAIPGATGNTGTPPAEHCHFAIRINGVKNPGFNDWLDATPYFRKNTMPKYFKINQLGKLGIMILEGFAGTLLFENDFAEYQTLVKITNIPLNAPEIQIPEGKFFRLEDHGKLGILVVDGFSGTALFENDFAEYKTLLQISGLTEQSPVVIVP